MEFNRLLFPMMVKRRRKMGKRDDDFPITISSIFMNHCKLKKKYHEIINFFYLKVLVINTKLNES